MKKCKKCGCEVSLRAHYCSHCGKSTMSDLVKVGAGLVVLPFAAAALMLGVVAVIVLLPVVLLVGTCWLLGHLLSK